MRVVVGSLLVGLAVLPGAALAQDAQSEEAQLRRDKLIWVWLAPPAESEERLDFGAWGELAAGADHTDQSSVGHASLGLGGRLLWSDEVCDLLELGAQLRITEEDGRSFSAEQWGSVCLMSGFPLPLLSVGHHLEWGVRPALSARPTRARERYHNEQLRLRFGMIDLPLAERSRLQLAMSDVSFDLAFDADVSELRADVAGRVSFLRYHEPRRTVLGRADLEVDVMPVRFRFSGDRYSADTIELDPVELRGIRLGDTGLYLDARAGFGWGLVSEPWDHSSDQQTLAEVATVVGRAALYGGSHRLRGGLDLTRELWPTMRDEVVLDNRAELWGALHLGRTRLGLRGFAAHTTTVTPGHPIGQAWTGGLRVETGYRLGGPFAVTAAVEGARSFYARVGDGSAPQPGWVLQARGALTAEIDSLDAPD